MSPSLQKLALGVRNAVGTEMTKRAISSALLTIDRLPENEQQSKKMPPKEELKFGKIFAPHMLQIHYNATVGWEAPAIVPFHDLQLSPAAAALHYGLECFEGG